MRIHRHLWIITALFLGFALPHTTAQARPLPSHNACERSLLGAEARAERDIHILVEGLGDVVARFYQPALASLIEQYSGQVRVRLTFTTMSAGESPAARERRLELKRKLEEMGASYLDKSNARSMRAYQALRPDVVLVATPGWTHAKLAQEWLDRKHPPKTIFLEKPLDSSREEALNLLERLDAYDSRVMAFDHYRPKMRLDEAQLKKILNFLGGGITDFKFYLLEDRSGSDPNLKSSRGRDGAIEEEGRVDTLREGVAYDLLSHMLAVLEYFGPVNTVRPVEVWAARYTGVDGDRDRPTEVPAETFFASRFVFHDRSGRLIKGEAAVGKGVRGVRALGPGYDHNAKLLDLVGLNGMQVRFDLRSSGPGAAQLSFMSRLGEVLRTEPLESEPYRAFIESIVCGQCLESGYAVHVEEGRAFLEKLFEFVHPARKRSELPLYPGGMRGIRPAPYLEELLEKLRPLSGPRAEKQG